MALIAKNQCRHNSLQFGSGDYYIFCHDCGRQWATIDDAHNLSPESANHGEGARLSGTWRTGT